MKQDDIHVNDWYVARLVPAGETRPRTIKVKVTGKGNIPDKDTLRITIVYPAPLSAHGAGVDIVTPQKLKSLPEGFQDEPIKRQAPPATIGCSEEGCGNTIPDHYWGKVKAEGWFFQKTGESWCPDHIPDWVEAWRARQKEKD